MTLGDPIPGIPPLPVGLQKVIEVMPVETGPVPMRNVMMAVADAHLVCGFFQHVAKMLGARSPADKRIQTCAEAASSIAAQVPPDEDHAR